MFLVLLGFFLFRLFSFRLVLNRPVALCVIARAAFFNTLKLLRIELLVAVVTPPTRRERQYCDDCNLDMTSHTALVASPLL